MVRAQYAADHLDDLLTAVNRGEEVEIAQAEKPSIKLVPSTPVRQSQGTKRILGAGVGEMIVPTDQEWSAMKKEAQREMNDAPLITSGEI